MQIINFFVPFLGPSTNKWNAMKGVKLKNGSYWNPKTEYTEIYKNLIEKVKREENIEEIKGSFFISYFPIVGGNIEYKNKLAKRGLDADNYAGSTKIIQDQLTRQNIIEEDNYKHLKGVYFNTFFKDKKLYSGFLVVIEKITDDQQYPDLKKHNEIKNKYIKRMLK